MGRPTTSGIYQSEADGLWHVDKIWEGHRLQHRGVAYLGEAESWLTGEIDRLKAEAALERCDVTFERAATYYIEKYEEKLSLETEIYLIEQLLPHVGDKTLDQVHDATLEPYVKTRQGEGVKAKTINLGLGVARRILNLAARSWRDDDGKPWLKTAPPLIAMLPEDDSREPLQLTWAGQRNLLPQLPAHLARMALFDLNTGLRDEALCNLQWTWEVKLEELGFSVFVVPKRYVKGRKRERVVVCNSVAQSIVESARGMHPEYVFVWSRVRKKGKEPVYKPIQTVNNTAWQSGRVRAGWPDLHVHDLRHTVGMRLRESGVAEETRDDILWHARQGMPAHYSVAQVVEIRRALELITDERHENNVSLASLIRAQRAAVPTEVPTERKTA